jgi:hypothetical protein
MSINEWTIDIRIEKNHLVTEIDGQLLLIDTGSPCSFGQCTFEWVYEEMILTLPPQPMNFQILRERIDLPLDGIIGSNLLLKRGLQLDISRGLLTLYDEIPYGSRACVLSSIMNVPVVIIDVGGIPQQIIIDTGAMQSFIDKQTALELPRVGSVRDFMPTGEEFTADLVEMEAVVHETKLAIQPAVSPPELESLLDDVSASGIIGLDVLQTAVFRFSPNIGFMSPAIRLNRIPSEEAVTFIGD